MTPTTLPTSYCIIGAGPVGMMAARAFLSQGLEVDIIERHRAIGGIWDLENPGTPMYESCSLITSRIAGGFVGFPMADHLPMYPKWSDMRDYVRDFAHEHYLEERCEFGLSVVRAEPIVTDAGQYWEVELSNGEVRAYRGVFAAVGSQWQPQLPEVPGLDTFTGRALHSAEYASPRELRGKRVLVVGAGNSGVDIASDAAFHAEEATLSTRRAYPVLPKQIFGAALPDVMDGRAQLPAAKATSGIEPEQLLELIVASVGDLSVYGLPSAEGIMVGQTHPIVSNTILHAFSHGLIQHRPDIAHIDGETVTFADGRTLGVDVIVFATGYARVYDFLPEGLVEYDRGHPRQHLETFVKGLDGFYSGGTLHAAIGQGWTMFETYALLAAYDARATMTGERAETLRSLKEDYDPDVTNGFPFLDVSRNVNQSDGAMISVTIPREITERFGLPLPQGYNDTEFYAHVPRRSRERALAAATGV
ncbi:Monooxygenase [Leucobacter sp. 7(1)]|uniref:flavin-containing monooxygenase n=1 Tax=Leucobacter sp. 7(1) TaxID=1255613 RepID=UPI00097EC796|nr:NAD(P)/FAD-dependent oxidoreductase [Leucobacter sp. 7(1)]SJN11575.1 Monooxygenase [Leucobacter sp. 7(1)]